MEPWELPAINGSGIQPKIKLVEVKSNLAAKYKLHEKYKGMHFVDRNPMGRAEDPPLEDATEWEHRVVISMDWAKRQGWMAKSKLSGTPPVQSYEVYEINETLHAMIRASTLNVCPMASAAVVDNID
jgi:hypothetical protein